MAYEAMNNAGARNERLIVILNDNDMSIAPPVGAMSAYLARLISGKTYTTLRDIGKQLAKSPAEILRAEGRARRGIRARLLDRRHAVRGARLLLCRPDRRPQSRPPAAGAAQRARRRDRPDPGARGDAEGQGLCAGGNLRRQISRRGQVRRRHRRAGEIEIDAPQYTKVFAESLIKEARKDDKIVAITAAMPSGTGLDLFAEGISQALLRRRHRRAARGDLRRRAGDGRLQAVRRDLFDLPAARLRPGGARHRHPAAAGALRASTAPAWSAPTDRPMPAPSTSPISAACPASC